MIGSATAVGIQTIAREQIPERLFFSLRITFVSHKHAAHKNTEGDNKRDDHAGTKYEEFHERSLFQ